MQMCRIGLRAAMPRMSRSLIRQSAVPCWHAGCGVRCRRAGRAAAVVTAAAGPFQRGAGAPGRSATGGCPPRSRRRSDDPRDARRRWSSGASRRVEIVTQYLARIGTVRRQAARRARGEPARAGGGRRARSRAGGGGARGPLHGIPIALKDNIHTTNMPTTGGALAFDGFVPPYEATLTKNLRDAGAIIIAKTGMTELANWVAGAPTPMPANYNAIGGFGFNPYDPRRDPRPATFDGRPALATGGSSSGIGTAANFWAGNVGTETSGSILSPANQNMLAAIKPTVGRISRYGVIPITADQDTAGPMAKIGDRRRDHARRARRRGARSERSGDAHVHAAARPRLHAVSQMPTGLKGARIGIPRAFFYDRRHGRRLRSAARRSDADAGRRSWPTRSRCCGAQGAVIVDPADIPSVVDPDPANNFLLWNICSGAQRRARQGRGLLGRVQVRHEARLQQMAGVAGAVRAGEDARRAARLEHRAQATRARSSTASRTSTSPTRWISSAIARATRPTAQRTCGCRRRTASTR